MKIYEKQTSKANVKYNNLVAGNVSNDDNEVI